MPLTLKDILALPDSPQRRGLLAQVRPAATPALTDPRTFVADGTVLAFSVKLALETVTENNTGGHWVPKAKRAKSQRQTVSLTLGRARMVVPPLPVRVSMTRLSRATLDTHDNLASAMKHVADAIAEDFYGVKDNDPRIEWATPTQEVAKGYAVRITIERRS